MFFPTQLPWATIRELTSIPGVARAPGGLAATWDAAPFLAARLGVPCPSSPHEDHISDDALKAEAEALPGLERYRRLELPQKLRPYQKEGALFLARRSYAMQCDPMRCIAGATKMIVNRAGCARRMDLALLVAKFNGVASSPGVGRGRAGHDLQGPDRAWRSDIGTYVPSYDEEGSIISNRVLAAHAVGLKAGLRVTTTSGRWVIASADHQFRTPEGYARLSDLRVGLMILVRTRSPRVVEGPRANPYRVLSVKNHPNARVYEVNRKDRPSEIVHHVLKHRLIYEAQVLNGMTTEEFCARVRAADLDGLDFLDKEAHVHHKDGDAVNNRIDNLEILTQADHSRRHAEEGAFRNVLWRAEPERIHEIEPIGDVTMFDLEMEDPYRNFVADDFIVHNSGKSLQSLAASTLIDAKRTLIICPALAKYVWAEEVSKWLKEEALILEGRAGDFVKRYCKACDARGRVKTGITDPDGVEGSSYCTACKMRNGQANGYKVFDAYTWEWDANGKLLYECPKHKEAPPSWNTRGLSEVCVLCQDELHDAMSQSRFIVCNYDILVSQKNADATGKMFTQENLQGWAPVLAAHKFDLAILDESHLTRGFSTDAARKGQTRRERVCEVVENIPTVWALTGTPIFGFVRDLWGQLDCISRGALTGGSQNDRLPFTFHAYFCEGAKDDYGWKADGRSLAADTELPQRLGMFKIQRPRSLILAQMPPKMRQVIRVDPTESVGRKKPRGTSDETKFASLLKKTFDIKVDTVVENVINELSEGSKCVIFVYLRESVEKMGKALEAACKKHDVKTRMREVDTKIWMAHGDTTPQARFEMSRAFREHPKAGVFIATIDAVQVAVSLKGATSVHFADLHWQPAALLQAEDRPYEVGTTGLTILYYIVRGSVDEHIEAVVLPKVRTLAEVVNEKGADELRTALAQGGQQTLNEIIKAMLKDVDTDLGAYDDSEE